MELCVEYRDSWPSSLLPSGAVLSWRWSVAEGVVLVPTRSRAVTTRVLPLRPELPLLNHKSILFMATLLWTPGVSISIESLESKTFHS